MSRKKRKIESKGKSRKPVRLQNALAEALNAAGLGSNKKRVLTQQKVTKRAKTSRALTSGKLINRGVERLYQERRVVLERQLLLPGGR